VLEAPDGSGTPRIAPASATLRADLLS
jgi:hypothetical protein